MLYIAIIQQSNRKLTFLKKSYVDIKNYKHVGQPSRSLPTSHHTYQKTTNHWGYLFLTLFQRDISKTKKKREKQPQSFNQPTNYYMMWFNHRLYIQLCFIQTRDCLAVSRKKKYIGVNFPMD